MKTSSYFYYSGPGRIGITVGTPRRVPAGYRMYRPLAPTRPMLKLGYAQYRRQYFETILGKLEAKAEWKKLHDLVLGHEPVLLCFEKPPLSVKNWCHRRMIAEWFRLELGEEVPEIGYGMISPRGVTMA